MNSHGKHKMTKSCILEQETNGYLSYGMEEHDTCGNKVDSFKDLEVRAKKYFKDSGFDKFGNDRHIDNPPEVKESDKKEDKEKDDKKTDKKKEKKTTEKKEE